MTQKTNQNPWTMDVRVRERNLKSGALTDKDLEKHLAALPDLSDQAESFGTSQPALVQQQIVPAISESAGVDEDDHDEDEDEDEQEEEVHAANGAGTTVETGGDADAADVGGGDVGGVGGSEGDLP